MESALVLVSGGLNSLVAAYVAKEEHEVTLLHVDYKHRAAEREERCFNEIAGHLQAQKFATDVSCFQQFGGNARVERRQDIEDVTTLGASVPRTFVAGLMPTLLGVAVGCAYRIKATRIFVGVSENLGSPGPPTGAMYPDYRREFYQRYGLVLDSAVPDRARVRLETPLMDLSREEIVRLGDKLQVPFELTWSCLRSGDEMCGSCYGCATRAQGFMGAQVVDPLFAQKPG